MTLPEFAVRVEKPTNRHKIRPSRPPAAKRESSPGKIPPPAPTTPPKRWGNPRSGHARIRREGPGCCAIEAISVACVALMGVMVFGNGVRLDVFDSSLTVSAELSRWVYVWISFRVFPARACTASSSPASCCCSVAWSAREGGVGTPQLRLRMQALWRACGRSCNRSLLT